MEVFTDITPDEFDSLSDKIVIDVRTPGEHADGKIEGNSLISIHSPTFQADLEKLDKEKTYVLYCRSGSRSSMAMNIMRKMGFKSVYNLGGGTISWNGSGRTLVR